MLNMLLLKMKWTLLLENNLIKKEKPKYNILLKDGKTYPWLCISKEEFPKFIKQEKLKKMVLNTMAYTCHHR